MYSGQAFLQQLLLYVALICVPWMLIAKPYTLWKEHQKKVTSGYRTVSGGGETNGPREEEDRLIQGEEEGEGHEEGGEGEHVSLAPSTVSVADGFFDSSRWAKWRFIRLYIRLNSAWVVSPTRHRISVCGRSPSRTLSSLKSCGT